MILFLTEKKPSKKHGRNNFWRTGWKCPLWPIIYWNFRYFEKDDLIRWPWPRITKITLSLYSLTPKTLEKRYHLLLYLFGFFCDIRQAAILNFSKTVDRNFRLLLFLNSTLNSQSLPEKWRFLPELHNLFAYITRY